jgi:hypothetical protein
MGLTFTIAAGPRQRSYSVVLVSRDLGEYFALSVSRLPATWRAKFRFLYPPGTGCRSYTPRHWVPFSSPTTRRAMMEVLEPTSTRGSTTQVKVEVMLRPTVQSASPSWNKEPIWGLRPDLYYCQTVTGLLIWGAISDERTGRSFARLSQQ